MRKLPVLLGLLATALVAGILALPRPLDGPAWRAQLLAAATAATGRRIEGGGEVRLEVLPWPRLRIDRVRLREPGVLHLDADRIDVDLALGALLGGRLEPGRLQLVRPAITIDRLALEPWRRLLERLGHDAASLRELQIVDGRAALAPGLAQAQVPQALTAVDLAFRFEPERRRASIVGSARLADEPLRVHALVDPVPLAGPAALKVELTVGDNDRAVTAAFQGSLRGADGPLAGKLRLAAPQGRLPVWLARLAGGEAVAALPGGFGLRGDLRLDAAGIALDELELDLAGTRARGRAGAAWAGSRQLEARLEAAQAAVTPELEAALRWLANASGGADGWRGRVELGVASLAWRAGEIRRLRAVLDLAPGHLFGVPRLDAVLPGETLVRWIGSEAGVDGISGELSLQASELRAFLAWLGVPASELPAGGLTSLDLSAQAELAAGRAALKAVEARLDTTLLAGSAAASWQGRRRVELALAADRVNTALYLGDHPGLMLDAWRRHAVDVDLALDLAVDRLSHDVWRDGKLGLRAKAENGRVEIGDLRLSGADGERLLASGWADLKAAAYDFAGELATGEGDRVASFLGLAPGSNLAGFLPVALTSRLQGDVEAASVDARLRAGVVVGRLHGSLGGPFDPRFLDLAGELSLPDPAAIAAALGWPAAAAGLGDVTATFGLTRDRGPLTVAASGKLGADGFRARLSTDLARPLAGSLVVEAPSLEVAKLGQLYSLLAAPLGIPAGWPWEWPGTWPQQAASWSWLDGPGLEVDLAAASLRHLGAVLPGARAGISRRDGRLTVTNLDLPLAGGKLAGSVTVEREADHALLSGDLTLRGARAEQIAGLLAPGSEVVGELDLGARILSRGRSIADFARSLEGEGELALAGDDLVGAAFPSATAPAIHRGRLSGPLRASRGVVSSGEPGLAYTRADGSGGRARLHLDLSAWVLELVLRDDAPGATPLRLMGAPGRLRAVPWPASP